MSLFTVSSGIEGTATAGNTTILTLSNTSSGNTTLSGTISDSSSTGQLALVVNNSGPGMTTLSAANTFSGGLTLSAGMLDLNNANAAGNSTVAMSGGTLAFSTGIGNFTFGGLSGSGNITLADTGSNPVTLLVGSNNAGATYSGVLSGSGGLTKIGSGVQTLNAAQAYTGTTVIIAGTLQVSGAGTLGTGNGNLTVNGGTLDLDGTAQSVAALNGTGGTILNSLASSASTLSIGMGNATGGSYAGVIKDNAGTGGTVALVKVGAGAQTLTNVSTFSGGTTISAGTLTVASGGINPLGSGTVTIGSSGTFNFTGTGVTTANFSNAVAGGGNVTTSTPFDPSGDWTAFSGNVIIGGAGSGITTFGANSTSGNASYILNAVSSGGTRLRRWTHFKLHRQCGSIVHWRRRHCRNRGAHQRPTSPEAPSRLRSAI